MEILRLLKREIALWHQATAPVIVEMVEVFSESEPARRAFFGGNLRSLTFNRPEQ